MTDRLTRGIARRLLELEQKSETGVALTEKEQSRWTKLMRDLLERLKPKEDRRRYLRIPTQADIVLRRGRETFRAVMSDISNGGMKIEGRLDTLALGQDIELTRIYWRGTEFPQQMKCRIAWIRCGEGVTTCAVGIEFQRDGNQASQDFHTAYIAIYRGFIDQLANNWLSAN